MGSWVRTITSPFRKARTILNQQSSSNSGSISSSNDDHHHHRHRAKKPRRHSSSSSSSGTPSSSMARGGDNADVDISSRSSQLYGDVMACAYEDVQVMWSMLDNKSRLTTAAS